MLSIDATIAPNFCSRHHPTCLIFSVVVGAVVSAASVGAALPFLFEVVTIFWFEKFDFFEVLEIEVT